MIRGSERRSDAKVATPAALGDSHRRIAALVADQRAESAVQRQTNEIILKSPRLAAQGRQLGELFGQKGGIQPASGAALLRTNALQRSASQVSSAIQRYKPEKKEQKEIDKLLIKYLKARNFEDEDYHRELFRQAVEEASDMEEIRRFAEAPVTKAATAEKKAATPKKAAPSTGLTPAAAAAASGSDLVPPAPQSTLVETAVDSSPPASPSPKLKETNLGLSSFSDTAPKGPEVAPKTSPEEAASPAAPGKKKSKKPKAVSLSEFHSTVASPGMNWSAAASSAPKASASSVAIKLDDDPVAPAEITNAFVQSVIDGTESVSVLSVKFDRTKDNTVYYKVTLAGPEMSVPGLKNKTRKIYTLYLHYHPAPTSSNWLHLKKTDGADPGNKIQPGNWMFKGYKEVLTAGRLAWEAKSGKKVASEFAL